MSTRQKRRLPSPVLATEGQEAKKKDEEEQSKIYHAPTPIHDRNSIFKAIFSPSQHYLTNPKLLQAHSDFQDAMHKMLAYRRKSSQKALTFSSSLSSSSPTTTTGNNTKYVTFSDEDGEKYAGRKLEKLLEDMGVEGVVVVARWYGGVLLGPVRFEHIVGIARDAILACTGAGSSSGSVAKRVRLTPDHGGNGLVVDELKERERLVRVLGERDASVGVLRTLLAEKTDELGKLLAANATCGDDNGQDEGKEIGASASAASQQQSGSGVNVSPSKPAGGLDYISMSLVKLTQMEKARDATLAWILKQIDAVEIKIKDAERELNKKKETNKMNDKS